MLEVLKWEESVLVREEKIHFRGEHFPLKTFRSPLKNNGLSKQLNSLIMRTLTDLNSCGAAFKPSPKLNSRIYIFIPSV